MSFHHEPTTSPVPRRAQPRHTAAGAFALALFTAFVAAVADAQPAQEGQAPPEAVAPKTVVVLEGQITDAAGSGQKDVEVTLHTKKKDAARGPMLAESKTNEYGDFALELPQRADGTFLVVLSKPKHEEAVHEVSLAKEGTVPFLAETLEGNVKLSGVVVSAAGHKPIPGAEISIETDHRDQFATSNEQGEFDFKRLAPGRAAIVVEAKGFGRQRERIVATEDAGKLTIVLKPERVVHIAIINDAGDPVSAATVEILDRPRNDMRAAITGKNGVATISGLHFDATTLLVRLDHPDHVSSVDFTERIDPPEDRPESDHQLAMKRAGKIRAKVLDAATGKPIYGARVMTGDNAADDPPRDWTDDNGIANISGVPTGGTVTTVHASGYAPTLDVIAVKVGDVVNVEFELETPSVVKGRVEDNHGEPIPGVEIIATQWRGYNTLGLRAMTNAKGEFVIENAPADEFQVTVHAPGAEPSFKSLQASAFDAVLELNLAALKAMARRADNRTQPKIGDAPPPITLTTTGGKKINLSQLRGKVVVLDFWATWCAPCVEELPTLVAINEKYKNRRDFMILGISRDFDERDLRSFLKSNPKVTWKQVVGEGSGSDEAGDRFGAISIPSIFVIGVDGKIAATDIHGSQLDARLKVLLEPEK